MSRLVVARLIVVVLSMLLASCGGTGGETDVPFSSASQFSSSNFSSSSGGTGSSLFESEGMRGVTTAFLSPVQIRGVEGPGAEWIIDEGEVEIKDLGMGSLVRLEVEVEGLVLDPATVPPPRGGTNPVANFRTIVSCLDGVDAAGNPTFTNVVSDPFPADEEGDAKLETMIMLPDPCFGIIVFVTSPGEKWFAATGL